MLGKIKQKKISIEVELYHFVFDNLELFKKYDLIGKYLDSNDPEYIILRSMINMPRKDWLRIAVEYNNIKFAQYVTLVISYNEYFSIEDIEKMSYEMFRWLFQRGFISSASLIEETENMIKNQPNIVAYLKTMRRYS